MRTPIASLVLAFACTLIAFPQTAPTQTRKTPAKSTAAAAAAPTPACACPPAPQQVQPYTAKQEITRVQTLADGSTIRNVDELFLSRDARGRTRRESIRSGNGQTFHDLEIFDSVTQTRYTWNAGPESPKVVNVYHARPNQQFQPPTQPQRYYPYRMESLPPQTIDGVYAQGSRTTRTTPAGYAGNDRDLVSTTETWYSPSLSLMLRSVTDDPRTGKSTTETSNVDLSDPDPNLFQPPTGYQLHDASQ